MCVINILLAGLIVEAGLIVTAETAMARFTAIGREDERVFCFITAEVLRTGDTDYIPYSRTFPAALLVSFFLNLVLLLPLASYLHHFHRKGERERERVITCSRHNQAD